MKCRAWCKSTLTHHSDQGAHTRGLLRQWPSCPVSWVCLLFNFIKMSHTVGTLLASFPVHPVWQSSALLHAAAITSTPLWFGTRRQAGTSNPELEVRSSSPKSQWCVLTYPSPGFPLGLLPLQRRRQAGQGWQWGAPDTFPAHSGNDYVGSREDRHTQCPGCSEVQTLHDPSVYHSGPFPGELTLCPLFNPSLPIFPPSQNQQAQCTSFHVAFTH